MQHVSKNLKNNFFQLLIVYFFQVKKRNVFERKALI